MLIRETRHACFVILRNGLTLELFYGAGAELADSPRETRASGGGRGRPLSQGIWMYREEVLVEAKVGLA